MQSEDQPTIASPLISYAHGFNSLAADQPYVAKLRRAVETIRWSAIAPLAALGIVYAAYWIDPQKASQARSFGLLLGEASVVLQLMGSWWLTSHEPPAMRSSGHRPLRWFIRIFSVGCVIPFPLHFITRYPSNSLLYIAYISLTLAGMISVFLCRIAILYFLRLVAKDIPSARLVTHARWLMWSLCGAYLLYFVRSAFPLHYVLYHYFYTRPSRSIALSIYDVIRFIPDVISLWMVIFLSQFHRELLGQLAPQNTEAAAYPDAGA
jgi:hypothetical protein